MARKTGVPGVLQFIIVVPKIEKHADTHTRVGEVQDPTLLAFNI